MYQFATETAATCPDLLNAVLQHLQPAMLVFDQAQRITALNLPMANALGIDAASTAWLGRPLSAVAPQLALASQAGDDGGVPSLVLRIGGQARVCSITALCAGGQPCGTLLTLAPDARSAPAHLPARQTRRPRGPLARYHLEQIQGRSPAMRQALAAASRCAASAATVLITGESGTGKELFAQAIHNAGPRADGPFVALNCASLPESLLESELFGYDEGSFTGARRGGKAGLFEAAHTGTIFLDEIGDMPLPLQTRLLRVLQEREVLRLGGLQPVAVDVRIIAATHNDLVQRMADGQFRNDLYYRLNVLRLALPALRNRPQDIPDLARQLLLARLRRQSSGPPVETALAPLLPALLRHSWPGNVRELENLMERLSAYLAPCARDSEIDYAGFLAECPELALPGTPLAAHRVDIVGALHRAGGNKQAAASLLGVSRTTLWRRLRDQRQA